MALKDNLKTARTKAGLSQSALASLAKVSQQLISQIETGVEGAGNAELPKIAGALGIDVEKLEPGYWKANPMLAKAVSAATSAVRARGSQRLPVFASARGGPGEIIIGNEPIDYAPHPLENVKDAFTVYVVGDSMSPAFEQGDLVLVHPHVPPKGGDDVIVVRAIEDEVRAGMVKRLNRATAHEWSLEQFNPPEQFKLQRSEWPQCLVIVGKYSRR